MTAQRNFFAGGSANPRNTGGAVVERETIPGAPEVTSAPAIDETIDALNVGTVEEVLEVVGDDALLASAAAGLEEDEDAPREDLIEALAEVAAPATAAGAPVAEFTQTVESFDGPPQG